MLQIGFSLYIFQCFPVFILTSLSVSDMVAEQLYRGRGRQGLWRRLHHLPPHQEGHPCPLLAGARRLLAPSPQRADWRGQLPQVHDHVHNLEGGKTNQIVSWIGSLPKFFARRLVQTYTSSEEANNEGASSVYVWLDFENQPSIKARKISMDERNEKNAKCG